MIYVLGLFWSLRFDLKTRLILVSTKPTPHARHVVCEPHRIRLDVNHSDAPSNNAIVANTESASNHNFAVSGNNHVIEGISVPRKNLKRVHLS